MNEIFHDGREYYELLHEFDILVTDNREFFFVLSIFGVELVINLGGRGNDGFLSWLKSHENISPLYFGKNKDH